MKKRYRVLGSLILLMIVTVIAAGCSGSGNGNSQASEQSSNSSSSAVPAKSVTLKIFLAKVEIAEPFIQLKKEYEASHPGVTLEIDSSLSGDDYYTALKAKFAAGEMPDIFNTEGYSVMKLWQDNLEALSDQTWVADMEESAAPGATIDGKLYGMPMSLEGVGYLYNKDLFAKAGITEVPTTLTGMKEAVQKLKAANIPAFVVPYGDWYSPGVFGANNPVAKHADPDAFLMSIADGSAKITDDPLFKDWLNLVDLEIANAQRNPATVDYNGQVTDFANELAAITVGCNCSQSLFDDINPKLNLGVMPMPLNDDAVLNDNLFVNVPFYWGVNKNSSAKPEAKEFLNWLVTSDIGKKYLTQQFHFIPAFKSIEVNDADLGTTGADVKKYVDAGKTKAWEWPKYPDGLTSEIGAAMQKYQIKQMSHEQLLQEIQTAWEKLSK